MIYFLYLSFSFNQNLSQQNLLEQFLIKKSDDPDTDQSNGAEGQIFYLKMKGDYLRYKAEVASSPSKDG